MAALTATTPAISGWCAANHTASVPPIDNPATTTFSQRLASSLYATSAQLDQSAHVVACMSSIVVP